MLGLMVPSTSCSSHMIKLCRSSLKKHRGCSPGGAYILRVSVFLVSWISLLTILPHYNVKEPCDHVRGPGLSTTQSSPLPSDKFASSSETDEPWTPNGLAGPKDTFPHRYRLAAPRNRNRSHHCDHVSRSNIHCVDLRHWCTWIS